MLKCFDQLESMNPDPIEKDQIDDARKAVQGYWDSAKQYHEQQLRNHNGDLLAKDLDEKNAKFGVAAGKAMEDYSTAKQSPGHQRVSIRLSRYRHWRNRSDHAVPPFKLYAKPRSSRLAKG